jgi:purine-binding chemotaxis protein CheW
MDLPPEADLATAAGGGAAPGGDLSPGPRADALADAWIAARVAELPRAEDGRFALWRPGSEPAAIAPAPPVADDAAAVPPPAALPHAPPAAPRAHLDPLDGFFYREDEEPFAPAGEPPLAGERPAGPRALEEYLTFLLAGEEYAVPIERVREVARCPPVAEVPRAPGGVVGVVTVRGDVVPVLDPRGALGLPRGKGPEALGRLVIVDEGDGPCGLLVDAIASVVRLERGSVEPCPAGVAGAHADCLSGVGRHRDRLFTVIEVGALLRRATAPRLGEGRAQDAP